MTVSVAADMPPLLIMDRPGAWQEAGLAADLASRFKSARVTVLIGLRDPGHSVVEGVTFATELADRVSSLAKGCVNDFRFGDVRLTRSSGHSIVGHEGCPERSVHAEPKGPIPVRVQG
jgi:hypothetical protein